MSTKFFDTKKSGIVKKSKTMKTGLIAMAVIAVTAAAGVGGYKLMNRAEERPHVAPQNTYSATTNANSYQPTPETRSTSSFSTFGFGSPSKNTAVAPVKKAKHGKHIAKHSKKHHGKKHFAKHSKKHHGKKHFAKHSKKHGKHYAKHTKKHGKHYAKHHKKKKKHTSEATASR